MPEVGVGLLGYCSTGKVHTNALKTIPYMIYPPPANSRLAAICGRNEEGVVEARRRYGHDKHMLSGLVSPPWLTGFSI